MKSKVKDSINILSKLTLKRTWNGLLVLGSYLISRITQSAKHRGLPVSISFEPTTSCNLRCPECPSGLRSFTRPTGMLDNKLFDNVINQLEDTLVYLTFYFQGEPYLHPQFLELVQSATSRNIYTATSTNAHFLSEKNAQKTVESGLDRLIISIDGTTQATYEAYRVGGRLSKVIEGAQHIVAWKKRLKSSTPYVIFQFLVVKPNEHQICEVKELAKKIGIDDVWLKTAQVYDYKNGNELIPEQSKYSRYSKNPDGTYRIKNQLLNHCWKMWHSCVITWDGSVVPCCFDKDAHHTMGSLETATFAKLWHGISYDKFRKKLLTGRDQIEMCQNCTEGSKVWT